MSTSEKRYQPPVAALYGLDGSHIDFDTFEKPVHAGMRVALKDLKHRADAEGFCLQLASGYRSFEQQLAIWNAKASGERPVLDSLERPLELKELSESERIHAILRWSALPGASRHHWGSEIDVYDARALSPGQNLKLTCDETEAGGVFENFYCWLDAELKNPSAVFFRPYAQDLGGVAPEPWHLSYRPLAENFQKQHQLAALRDLLAASDILLKNAILAELDTLYQRYFARVIT